MMDAWKDHRIALVLAGGNALGAYQAGVYETLHEHGIEPHWIVGTSAGAINGAVIAGNAPANRVARLQDLWRPVVNDGGWPMWWDAIPDTWRRTGEALGTMLAGRSGLFAPIGSSIASSGATPALYDTSPLSRALVRLVDFDRVNDGSIRYAAVAVDLDNGHESIFDTAVQTIAAEHVRASAAMPPNFPAVPITGRLYVDGGLSANLPLDSVLAPEHGPPLLCIAVDLLPLSATRPTTLGEVIGRTQDLIFGCQSRRSIAGWRAVYAASIGSRTRSVTLVRLTYTDQAGEVAGKAMDFSPTSVRGRWDAGRRDAAILIEQMKDGRLAPGGPGLTIHNPAST